MMDDGGSSVTVYTSSPPLFAGMVDQFYIYLYAAGIRHIVPTIISFFGLCMQWE